jgi:hypothetical protein
MGIEATTTSTRTENPVAITYDTSFLNTGTFVENSLLLIVSIKTGATAFGNVEPNNIRIYSTPAQGTVIIEGICEKINVIKNSRKLIYVWLLKNQNYARLIKFTVCLAFPLPINHLPHKNTGPIDTGF